MKQKVTLLISGILITTTVCCMEEQKVPGAAVMPQEQIINFDAMTEIFNKQAIVAHLELIRNYCIENGCLPDDVSKKLQIIKGFKIVPAHILPCLKLFPQTIKDAAKIERWKSDKTRLVSKIEDSFKPSDPNIDKVKIKLESKTQLNISLSQRQSDNIYESHDLIVKLEEPEKVVCIAGHNANNKLFVGLESGTINTYNAITRQWSDEALDAHLTAVEALNVCSSDALISRSVDHKVYLWNLAMKRPFFMINAQHRNDYVCKDGSYLVQSHVNQTSFGTYLRNNDQLYRIPKRWLSGLPGEDGTSGRFGFIYMLYMLNKYDQEKKDDAGKLVQALYACDERRDFEIQVVKTFKEYLKDKAQQFDVKLK